MFRRFLQLFSKETIKVEVFRCDSCGRAVSTFDINRVNKIGGDICKCGQNQLRPTNPSLWEAFLILLKYIIKGY
jgi:hypothetical protein